MKKKDDNGDSPHCHLVDQKAIRSSAIWQDSELPPT